MQNNQSGVYFASPRSAWTRLWDGWYRLTAPAEPPPSASLEQREMVRRARLNSIVLLILFVFNIPSVPSAVFGTNKALFGILVFLIIMTIVAVFINRRGAINVVGGLIVVTYSVAVMTNILTTPGGFTLAVIPLFILLIIPETAAAAMLPPIFVFISAIANAAFCILVVNFMPHPHSMDALMPVAYSDGVFLPITVLGVMACIDFLWARSLDRALRERDQAQEVARLEHDLSEQTFEMTQQKEQLERSIELINQTQARVANGDLSARVPLTSDNVLWSVAGTLNNLISRLQRMRDAERELELTRSGAGLLFRAIQARKAGQSSPRYTQTGTVLDPIAAELFAPGEVIRTPSAPPPRSSASGY